MMRSSGWSKIERFCMRERLRGGMDGDWTCQHCGRQGCWVTKVRCYRCGKSKYDPPNQQPMDGNMPGWIRSQARQQTEREWAQATRGAGVASGTGGQPLCQKTSSASAATKPAATESKAESSGTVERSFSCPRGGIV